MIRKTLASIVLAAGLSTGALAQTYTYDHFDAGRGLYYYVDSNGDYLSIDKDHYNGQKNIILNSASTTPNPNYSYSQDFDVEILLENTYQDVLAKINSNDPNYDDLISEIKAAFRTSM